MLSKITHFKNILLVKTKILTIGPTNNANIMITILITPIKICDSLHVHMLLSCVCIYVCMCVRVCLCICIYACMLVYVWVRLFIYFLFILVKPPIRRIHTIYTYIKMVIKAVSKFPCHRV